MGIPPQLIDVHWTLDFESEKSSLGDRKVVAVLNYQQVVPDVYNVENIDEDPTGRKVSYDLTRLHYQNGNPNVVGINGFTIEEVLLTARHRLSGFQETAFNCDENDLAIFHIEQAIKALNKRTKRRIEENKEGTQIP